MKQCFIAYLFGARFDLALKEMGNSDLVHIIKDTFKSAKQNVFRSEL